MVVHSPDKFEVQRAAQAAATAAADQAARQPQGNVPPSVLGAGAAAAAGSTTAVSTNAGDVDLLGDEAVEHDFDAWDGDNPPARHQALVHSGSDQNPNVTTRRHRRAEEDRISVADSIHCLLYTSPSPRDLSTSRMPSSA